MITSINKFKLIKESLSAERTQVAKLESLIKLGRDMIESHKKLAEITELKKVKDAEIKELLTKLNEVSIVAKSTLVQLFKPYKTNNLSSKAYFAFVESSVNVITADFKSISDEVKAASVKIKAASSHLRKTNNTSNKVTGELTAEGLSDVWSKIVTSLKSWISKFSSLINKTSKHLESISVKAEKFLAVKESVKMNEELSDEDRQARNKYSRDYKQRQRDLVKVLEKAKESIELAEQQAYYKALSETNEVMVKNLLTEFHAKSVAIDDKIITLVNVSGGESFDMQLYKEKMLNAEEVGAAVALMAKALMDVHTNISENSGSVRQYKDDTESADGTLGVTFDHEELRTKLPQNESVLRKIWSKIKMFFTSFKEASTELDIALNNI